MPLPPHKHTARLLVCARSPRDPGTAPYLALCSSCSPAGGEMHLPSPVIRSSPRASPTCPRFVRNALRSACRRLLTRDALVHARRRMTFVSIRPGLTRMPAHPGSARCLRVRRGARRRGGAPHAPDPAQPGGLPKERLLVTFL